MQLYACSTAYIGSGVYRIIDGEGHRALRDGSSPVGSRAKPQQGSGGLRSPEAGAFSKK
jgi:hypothetical protein